MKPPIFPSSLIVRYEISHNAIQNYLQASFRYSLRTGRGLHKMLEKIRELLMQGFSKARLWLPATIWIVYIFTPLRAFFVLFSVYIKPESLVQFQQPSIFLWGKGKSSLGALVVAQFAKLRDLSYGKLEDLRLLEARCQRIYISS